MKMDHVVRTVRFGYVLLCILLCAMGGLLIFFPGTSLKVLCRLLGGVMLVCGAAKLIGYLTGTITERCLHMTWRWACCFWYWGWHCSVFPVE
jgi:uncharacterized membrane protein HdeD (DUF308 family)